PWAQLDPLPVGQYLDVETLRAKVVVDPRAAMVGEEDDPILELLQGIAAQVIGMPVRDPEVLAAAPRLELLGRDLVRKAPTAEVRWPSDPGVGGEERASIVKDERRISDGLESAFEDHGLPSGPDLGIRPRARKPEKPCSRPAGSDRLPGLGGLPSFRPPVG